MIMRNYIFAAFLGLILGGLQAPNSSAIVFQKLASKAYPGGFSVNITSNVKTPIEAGIAFTLEANITMENGSGDFEFQWLFPEEVKVIAGVIDPRLTFGPNGSAQTKITLMIPNSRINYQIIAEAYRMNQQGVRGAVAQFNTNPSNMNEKRLPDHKKHRVLQ